MGQLKDLTGQRFGLWTVIERDDEILKKNIYWKCKCDCGTIRSVAGTSLRGGISFSCGCDKDRKTSQRAKTQTEDLVGKTFGYWTVLRFDASDERTSKRGARWICRCICGREKSVLGYALKDGRSSSCGCNSINRIKDLTNKRFGKLVALRMDDSSYDRKYGIRWICRCDCGNECSALSSRLTANFKVSCGLCENEKRNYPPVEVGNVYGKLTVLSFVERENKDDKYWLCKCECGNEKMVEDYALRSGRTVSCGCIRGVIKNDLTGKHFGELTVIGYDENVSKEVKHVVWKCQCSCGEVKHFHTSLLMNGKVKSCGCLNRKESSKRRFIDITGQRFGRLTAISVDRKEYDNAGNTSFFWLCQCDCGNTKVVDGNVLRCGYTISCGCVQAEASAERAKSRMVDIVGKRYGLLTVLERIEEQTENNKSLGHWRCKCDCGNEKIADGYYLRKGMVSSCGCLNQSKLELFVIQYFNEQNYEATIDYNYQIRFEGLRGYGDGMLSYDFAVYKGGQLSCFIECQGQQHYHPVGIFGGEEQFAKQQLHDEIKRNYAKSLGVKLIEIPYTLAVYENVRLLLDKEL